MDDIEWHGPNDIQGQISAKMGWGVSEAATEKRRTDLLDELARLEHEQWKSWALTLLDTEHISTVRSRRWLDLIDRGWSGFTEEEKDRDREWAEKILRVIKKHMGIK